MKRLFNLKIALTLFVFLVAPCVFAKDLKFIQITDSHFSHVKKNSYQKGVENSETNLIKTIDDINNISDVDFVMFTGDNIDTANSDDLKAFLTIANKLKSPYYMVIGNHEVFKSQHFDKKEYMKTVNKYSNNCHYKTPNYVFEKKGLVFVVVDGAKEVIPGPAGYFKKDTLKWLDKTLTKYKNCKVVIFQHFPIVDPYFNRTHTTYNKQAYEDVLKKHTNVISIVSGHYHGNGENMVNEIYHISTPALVVPPHNFKIIEITGCNKKGYNIYTQLRHAE